MALLARTQPMPVDVWAHDDPGSGPEYDTIEPLADKAGRVMVFHRATDREPHGFGVAAVCTIPRGTVVAPGLITRLLVEVNRPGRRLVRVDTGGAPIAMWHPSLLAIAGASIADVLDDAPDIDRAVWEHAAPELEAGQWRHWVDGQVIGAVAVDLIGDVDPLVWAAKAEGRHALTHQIGARARGVGRRVRREVFLARSRHR